MKNILYQELFVQFKYIFRMMKNTFLALFIFVGTAYAADSYSQNMKVTLVSNSISAEKVINEIENQTDYLFVYDVNNVNLKKRVKVNAQNKPVSEVLDQIFAGTDIAYAMEGKNIMLMKRKEQSATLQQVDNIVTGIVKDSKGESIIGANIKVKGQTTGTITDFEGRFTLEIPENSVLQVSYIGYVTQEIKVGAQKDLTITLKEDTETLDEVVVVGYGTQRKGTLASAVGTLSGKSLESKPFQNVGQALQGRIPGLIVNRNSGGAPGAGVDFQIRGLSSLNGGTPLVLVDGVETQLNVLNTYDIESISVLKDASASIYGARASDGVILVTTKSGKEGKMKIDFNAYYALKVPAFLRETVSLYEYAMMSRDAASDGSIQPGAQGYEFYTDEDLEKILANDPSVERGVLWGRADKFYKNQDWHEQLLGNSHMQNYAINISGGTQRVKYLFSSDYQAEGGIVKIGLEDYKRYNLRTKVDFKILDNLNFKSNISYSVADKKSSVTDYFFGVINQMRCWVPIYNPAGNFYRYDTYPQPGQMVAENGYSQNNDHRINSLFTLEYEFLPGLKLIGNAAINNSLYYSKSISIAYDKYDWDNNCEDLGTDWNGSSRGFTRKKYRNYNLLLEFNREISQKHNLNVLLGASQEQEEYDSFNASRNNFINNQLFELGLGDPSMQGTGSNANAWAIRSYFGRLGYIYNHKYILDATFRYDGSSRFSKGHRWGFFPGVSVAWIMSEEGFYKKSFLSDTFLKLRASYGEVGNQSGIGLYDYFQTIIPGNSYYPFDDFGTKYSTNKPGNMVTVNRTWERVMNTNFGIDLKLLSDRLTLNFDYFFKRNNSMLVGIDYPTVLGTPAPWTNNGKLKVKGYELSIGWNDKIGKDFHYSITATLSDAKNKVVYIGGADSYSEGLNWARQGYPVNSYFGYLTDGYIQSEEELIEYKKIGNVYQGLRVGDLKYKDLDGDGSITPFGDGNNFKGDMVYLGDTNPRYNIGLSLAASWKGIDFSAFFQGVARRKIMLTSISSAPFYQPWYDPQKYFYGNTWSEDNRNARYPRMSFNSDVNNWNYRTSDNRLENAAYFRLKDVQLGYSLPNSLTKKVRMEKVRIYVSASDLLEFHNMPQGWNPEDPSDSDRYPFTRFISFGTNLTF